MDDRERRRAPIRLGAAVLLVLLPAQFAVSFFVEEIYPGITGPSFAGRPAKGGVVRYVDCEVEVACAAGDTRAVACPELIADSAHRSVFILRGLFPQNRPRCEEPTLAADAGLGGAAQYLRERLAWRRARCEPLSDALREWLRPHAAEAAGCDARSLELVWQDVQIDPATGARTHTQRARHVVAFDARASAP